MCSLQLRQAEKARCDNDICCKNPISDDQVIECQSIQCTPYAWDIPISLQVGTHV